MKKLMMICVVVVFASFAQLGMAQIGTDPGDDDVNTIRDGEVLYLPGRYLEGEVVPKGYDDYGYNYMSHLFSGSYFNSYANGAGFPPYDGDDESYLAENPTAESHWAWPYRQTNLTMKWNDAWLANTDRDLDGELDRHWGFDSYLGSGAWLTNVMSGSYELEVNGEITEIHWNSFTKIIAVPADAVLEDGIWFTANYEEIGYVIWGQFAITQDVYNDPGEAVHGKQYLSPTYPGLGNLTSEVMGSE